MMMTTRTMAPACVLAWAALLLTGCSAAENVFAGTTKIELAKDLQKGKDARRVVVTDPAEIARLVDAIRIEKKNPCACDHVESAAFTTPKGVVTVSLCDHCFDFGGKTYKMPAEFYRLFESHFK